MVSLVEPLVPLATRETPVGRQVMKSLEGLDWLTAQAGLYLRTYPALRLVALVYFLVLHLMLFFILISWSHDLPTTEKAIGDKPEVGIRVTNST